jgi:hypothetical protein
MAQLQEECPISRFLHVALGSLISFEPSGLSDQYLPMQSPASVAIDFLPLLSW